MFCIFSDLLSFLVLVHVVQYDVTFIFVLNSDRAHVSGKRNDVTVSDRIVMRIGYSHGIRPVGNAVCMLIGPNWQVVWTRNWIKMRERRRNDVISILRCYGNRFQGIYRNGGTYNVVLHGKIQGIGVWVDKQRQRNCLHVIKVKCSDKIFFLFKKTFLYYIWVKKSTYYLYKKKQKEKSFLEFLICI